QQADAPARHPDRSPHHPRRRPFLRRPTLRVGGAGREVWPWKPPPARRGRGAIARRIRSEPNTLSGRSGAPHAKKNPRARLRSARARSPSAEFAYFERPPVATRSPHCPFHRSSALSPVSLPVAV